MHGENHGRIRGGQERVRHGAHGAALHAAVIIGGRRGRAVRRVLVVHFVMVVLAMAGGGCVMGHGVQS